MAGPRFDLKGTRVLVTGAAQGLGLGLAETLSDWGATVGIADYNGDQLEQARARLDRSGGGHWAGKVDVADEASVDEGVAQCWRALGGIDLLINNAGVLSVAPVAELSLAEWTRILTVNATGVFLMSRAVVRIMLSEKRAGSIVSISSIGGKRGDPGIAHYAASKFAVIGFTQALAREVAKDDILVNAVCPGVVETKMMTDFARNTRNDVAGWVKDQVIPRIQTPADIAGAIAFLHQSRAVTGQAINVDGGTLFH